MTQEIRHVHIDQLMADPSQPRKSFLADEIERLAASIKARGMLLPLRVLFDEERQCWRIITGECRWRAARLAGLQTVPCLPVEGEISETDILSDQIIENSVRNAFRPTEFSRALTKLEALKGCTAKQLAEELGIDPGSVTRAKALLTLPEPIQAMIDQDRISPAAAYEISRLPDEAGQMELAQAVAAKRINRDQAAEAVRRRIGQRSGRASASRVSCKLDGGLSITVSSGESLTWDGLITALDSLRKHARRLCDTGRDVSELRSLKTS